MKRHPPAAEQALTNRMARHPGFVAGHRSSGWLMRWLEEAMTWRSGCRHVERGIAHPPYVAYAGRRWCWSCVGVFDDPWCVRCGVDAGEDIVLVRAQQGVVLVVFGLCPACHSDEMREDPCPLN